MLETRRTDGSGGGRTANSLRHSNLATIFGMVHRAGALSRAELTRRTGLNRSTMGECLSDLADLGLVVEARPETGSGRGRPSPIIRPYPGTVAVTVNPEVDAIRIGLVAMGGRIIEQVRLETDGPADASEVVRRSADVVDRMLDGQPYVVAGLAVAVPGQVRLSDGHVRDAPHFGWVEEPLAADLERVTGLPTSAANAALLGMYGECAFGSGRGVDDLVYMIGGASGIGGGVLSGGALVTGSAGYAGELGHLFVRSDGAKCPCGAHGCLEAEVTQPGLLDAVGLAPAQVERLEAELLRAEDPAVHELVDHDRDLLAIAVRSVVNLFNPSVVVLGGFLSTLHRVRAAPLLSEQAIRASRECVEVRDAELGADQLTVGTAELAFSSLLADPASAQLISRASA
ncbi:ROK family transcriptional regulator [Ruania alba]|nr:ROK family transcriptional regulator [Ruania alba]